MPLKLRRGTDSGRSAITPAEGEPIFTTDTKKLYVGDGSTAGGIAVDTAVTDGDKGDITVSSSGATWTIDNDAVTYAKIQNVSAASRLLGRGSASGSGDVQELTIGSGLTLTGTELSASGGGGLGDPTAIITKTADETITNSTTLQNDDHFSYSLVSGRYYVIEWILFVSRTNTTDNCGWKFTVSANSDGYFAPLSSTGVGTLANGTLTTSASNFPTNAGVPSRVSLQCHIKCTSDNTLQVLFAQQTLSANTGITFMKNSRMLIWDLGT